MLSFHPSPTCWRGAGGEVSGHRIVTAAAPRMAARQAFYGEPKPFEKPIPPERDQAVFAARRRVAARRRHQRRDQFLVNPD